MTSLEKVLVERDGMSETDAHKELEAFREETADYVMNGDLESLEDALMYDFGVEPDYIFDVLGF